MRIEQDIKLDFKDVLIRPKRSTLVSRSGVDISRDFVFPHSSRKYHGIPIIASNMDTVGTFEMADALARESLSCALHKHYGDDALLSFFAERPELPPVFYSMGITPPDYDKFVRIMEKANGSINYVCVDVANGYTRAFIRFIHKLRSAFPEITLMAGNVVTGEMTEELILDGVDIVKVGIGPGSVCTTRKVAGVGYPQLSAIIECADAAHGLRGLICADGGCTCPGDLAKAFGAGADFVMLGGMFAGHNECASEIVEIGGVRKMRFYGMSSREAMARYAGGVADYRAAEGKEVLLDYRGAVIDTVREILGGVRSACTYVGALRLKELSKRTTFVRVSQQTNDIFGTRGN
ncbi:MAG: GMP reductase [Candidatus Accumulibacter sp.]|jgi:GMP reductase|nr:GMP reductase [Accumulibacter sp.]